MDMAAAAAAGSYFSVCWAHVGNGAFIGQQIVMVLHVACGMAVVVEVVGLCCCLRNQGINQSATRLSSSY